MNCINHPEVSAAAFCRTCGRALCDECKRIGQGVVYCQEHAPVAAEPVYEPVRQSAADSQPVSGASASPGLAFVLGLIPGVGAIYNGQYAKGLVHAIIFGMLLTIQNNDGGTEPLFAILTAAWLFYMAFEAYHTARKRVMGMPVDEFSSLVEFNPRSRNFPIGAVALIVLGVLFLLNTLDILRLGQVLRFWPVALIAIGAYMLYVRLAGNSVDSASREVNDGRR